ncbi:hydrogenase maturation protease [Massilia niastensis]|uniref:hydrogenase maturation protease n=1 Tax=Massilia niastensis TaxID=544911 RepID=UPI0003638968|nr:hydrogenase maturation protease [Massilia niastensis]
MIPIRLIGIGSPSGDDRIGWDVIEALVASGLLQRFPAGTVEACCCDRPGALLALFREVELAVVIDAMQSGAPAGTVRRLGAEELAPGQGMVSCHGIGVAEQLALGRALGLLPPALLLYGIEAPHAAAAAEPAPEVRAAIPELLRLLVSDLEDRLGAKPGLGAAAVGPGQP